MKSGTKNLKRGKRKGEILLKKDINRDRCYTIVTEREKKRKEKKRKDGEVYRKKGKEIIESLSSTSETKTME